MRHMHLINMLVSVEVLLLLLLLPIHACRPCSDHTRQILNPGRAREREGEAFIILGRFIYLFIYFVSSLA